MSCGCGCENAAIAEEECNCEGECVCPSEAKAEMEYCDACEAKTSCAEKGVCAKKKKDGYASECGIGEEMVDGECRRIAVTMDIEISATHAFVEASTGNTIIEITGIAFHEGFNKNKWAISAEGAREVAKQMIGADLTLNHPQPLEGEPGFDRNTDGGLDEANVGKIVSATFLPTIGGGYEVRYIAHVYRQELFETIESGLYLREDYGVSIGGSGIPIQADEDGVLFGEDFTFDHLALVHRPAYPRANVETVSIITEEEASKTFISQSKPESNQQPSEGHKMTAEEIVEEIVDTTASEIEQMKADLVMANARVAEFEAAESERVESARIALVEKATEIGMSGHEDLKSETLETLIASWEESHPDPEPVVMDSVEETPVVETPVISSEAEITHHTPVVANYLNGDLVESDEGLYERAYNAWAKAWNGTLSNDESSMRAKPFSEIKEMI